MRQLWVQLSLAFTLVVVIAAITVSAVSRLSERATVINLGYELLFRDGGMIDALENHFEQGRPIARTQRIVEVAINDCEELS